MRNRRKRETGKEERKGEGKEKGERKRGRGKKEEEGWGKERG